MSSNSTSHCTGNATQNITNAWRLKSTLEQTVHCWLQKFASSDLNLQDKPDHESQQLWASMEVDLQANSQTLGAKLSATNTTIGRNLEQTEENAKVEMQLNDDQ